MKNNINKLVKKSNKLFNNLNKMMKYEATRRRELEKKLLDPIVDKIRKDIDNILRQENGNYREREKIRQEYCTILKEINKLKEIERPFPK